MKIRPYIESFPQDDDELNELLGIEKYPLISWPSRTEVGPAGSDEWDIRYYDMFVLRHNVGVEIRK